MTIKVTAAECKKLQISENIPFRIALSSMSVSCYTLSNGDLVDFRNITIELCAKKLRPRNMVTEIHDECGQIRVSIARAISPNCPTMMNKISAFV